MQASKIMVGKVYAIMHKGEPARFYVTAVTTQRHRNTGSPHDYTSWVEGVNHDGERDADGKFPTLTVNPEKVLGPFEEQAVLIERQRKEKAEAEAVRKEKEDDRLRLRSLLYRAAGIDMPNAEDYREPIRSRSSDVEIDQRVVKALVAFLENALKGN